MGRTFKVALKKIKVNSDGKNRKGYRWVRARRLLKKKTIPRIRNSKQIKYVLRSAFARKLSLTT
jgi:hypothetical protein